MNVHDKAIKIIKHIKPQTQSDYLSMFSVTKMEIQVFTS